MALKPHMQSSTRLMMLVVLPLTSLYSSTQAAFVDGEERFKGAVKDLESWEEMTHSVIRQYNGLTMSPGGEITTRVKTVGIGESVRVQETILPGGSDFQLFLTTNSEKTDKSVDQDSSFLIFEHRMHRESELEIARFRAAVGGAGRAVGRQIGVSAIPSGTVHILEISRTATDSALFSVFDEAGKLLFASSLSLENVPEELFITLRASRAYVQSVSVVPFERREFRSARVPNQPEVTYRWQTSDEPKADRNMPDILEQQMNQSIRASEHFTRASSLQREGKLEAAMAEINEALRLAPSMAPALVSRGAIFRMKGQYDKAIADLQESLRLAPSIDGAHVNLGLARLALGEFDTALRDFDQAITLDASRADYYVFRSLAWVKKGESDNALNDLTEAIRRDPKDALSYCRRGQLWQAKGNYKQALQNYEKSSLLDPKNIVAHNNLAWVLATCPQPEHHDGEKAITAATTACELTGWSSDDCLNTLSAAYARAGKFEKALEYLEKAVEINPDFDRMVYKTMRLAYETKQPYVEPQ